MSYWFRMVLAAASVAVLPAGAWAQASGPRASPGLQQPQLRDDEQIMPSQIVPAPPAKPKVAAKPKPKPAPAPRHVPDAVMAELSDSAAAVGSSAAAAWRRSAIDSART